MTTCKDTYKAGKINFFTSWTVCKVLIYWFWPFIVNVTKPLQRNVCGFSGCEN